MHREPADRILEGQDREPGQRPGRKGTDVLDPSGILIVRPSALGDVCRTVPVLATLRRAFPQARIDWIVQQEYVAAIGAHPDLDEAVCFPRGRFARWWRNPRVAWEMLRWFAGLRRRRYDLVIDCQGLGRSGLITWATRAARRVGPRAAREFGWLGYTVRHVADARHTVDQMMALLSAEGLEPAYDMRLYVADADRLWWRRQRLAEGVGARYAVLAPTSRWPGKRWPQRQWLSLVEPLAARGFERVVLVGSPSEARQVRTLVEEADPTLLVSLVGQTTVGQTMAVLNGAGLVVANDSAPLHMAVGLQRPCLGLYGPTDPDAVGPYGRPHAVLQGGLPAGRRSVNYKDAHLGVAMMATIDPSEVLARIDWLLEAEAPPAAAMAVAPAGPADRALPEGAAT